MRFLIAALALLVCACSDTKAPEPVEPGGAILTSAQAVDEFTFARPLEARVTHVSLDLELDFEARRVHGTASLDLAVAEDAAELVLDTAGLDISAVRDGTGNPLAFAVGPKDPVKGEPLIIQLGDRASPGGAKVVIAYASAPEAEALQWLDPKQTAGGAFPFMFSQGQAILNRSWIPTQDSPGIRQTWDARITAPAPLKVVMSGISPREPQELDDGRRVFTFAMENSVPPYLIAIAAGDLAFTALGPRSGVWAEPVTLAAAAEELVDTEEMIEAAETLYGPYRWGRYDMIVLPPSFPYGGMENPVMTFLTPTFIAGDRSNTGLVAHELAHSWSGNLVTYASWRDGWLNEGVTSYIESRISEAVFGVERAEQEYALSFAALEEMVAEQGADNPATAMRTPAAISPFDTAGEAIYDKGTAFLRTVERIVGRDRFDQWLRGWFDRHAFQPATSEMFLADLRANLVGDDADLEAALMLDEWVYGTGLPQNVAQPAAEAFAGVDAALARFAADRTLPDDYWDRWTTAERLRFLRGLPQDLSSTELARLDTRLDLSGSRNTEIVFEWLQAALRNQYSPAASQAQAFLGTVGRNKFVEPLYATLVEEGEWGLAIARPLYARTRPGYHSYTRNKVDPLLDWDD